MPLRAWTRPSTRSKVHHGVRGRRERSTPRHTQGEAASSAGVRTCGLLQQRGDPRFGRGLQLLGCKCHRPLAAVWSTCLMPGSASSTALRLYLGARSSCAQLQLSQPEQAAPLNNLEASTWAPVPTDSWAVWRGVSAPSQEGPSQHAVGKLARPAAARTTLEPRALERRPSIIGAQHTQAQVCAALVCTAGSQACLRQEASLACN